MKKTIGYVLDTFPVLTETFVGNEMRGMRDVGHEVVPIVLQRNDGPAQDIDRVLAQEAVYLDQVPARAAFTALVKPGSSAASAFGFLAKQRGLPRKSLFWNALKIAHVAKSRGCTHLHAHFSWGASAHAIVAARWAGMSVSFVCHGYDVYASPIDLPAKLQNVDFAIAVCKDLADHLTGLAPQSTVHTIHCGIDPNRFQPSDGPATANRILFIGRLVESKGLTDLIPALAALPPDSRPMVDVVGDGPLRGMLGEMAVEAGVAGSMNFLGSVPSGWIAENGPGYAAFVAPFRAAANGDRDTGPVAVKEAMAMGLPVVANRFMGLREMITPDCGWLVAPRDITALAEALKSAAQLTGEQRAQMGRHARQRVIDLYSTASQATSLSQAVEAV